MTHVQIKYSLNVYFRVFVWALRVVSHKIPILFENQYKFVHVFPGTVFVLKANISYLGKFGF
jgi:hypothetical protein